MEDEIKKNTTEWKRMKTQVGEKMEEVRSKEKERLNRKKTFLVEKVRRLEAERIATEPPKAEEREMMEGIKISDEELNEIEEREKKEEPLVYGDLVKPLDREEREAAMLNPKMQVYGGNRSKENKKRI